MTWKMREASCYILSLCLGFTLTGDDKLVFEYAFYMLRKSAAVTR